MHRTLLALFAVAAAFVGVGCGVTVSTGTEGNADSSDASTASDEKWKLVASGTDSGSVPNGSADSPQLLQITAAKLTVNAKPVAPLEVHQDVQCTKGSTNRRKQSKLTTDPPVKLTMMLTIQEPDSCTLSAWAWYEGLTPGRIETRIFAKCRDHENDAEPCNDFGF